MSGSLRRRILLGTTGTMSAVVLVGAVAVWMAAQALLYRALDQNLQERARMLALPHGDPRRPPPHPPGDDGPPPREGERDRPERGPGERGPERRPERGPDAGRPPLLLALPRSVPPEFRAEGGTVFAQVTEAGSGVEIARSPSLPAGISLVALAPPLTAPGRVVAGALPDGRPLRLLVERLVGPGPGRAALPPWLDGEAGRDPRAPSQGLWLQLAIDASGPASDLRRLAWVLTALWALTTGLAAAVAVWLQRTVLRPVGRISQAITGIDAANLQARVPMDQVPDEMRVILERLNALLARLETAFAREKSTIASIAHELRTPVAGLLMTVELALARDPALPQPEVLRKCLRIATAMQTMIANLLTLARLESGQAQVTARPVDLVAVARTCWDALAERAQERRVTLRWEIAPPVLASADEEQMRMVLGNVLDNAVSYTPVGGEIVLELAIRAGRACLTVANPTDGTLTDASEVFQPFWRGDAARTAGLHCGLGLSLVQRLVLLAGGTASAQAAAGRFTLLIELPAAA
jgi:signal transduction histidine kinase